MDKSLTLLEQKSSKLIDISELFDARLGYPVEEKYLLAKYFSIMPLKTNSKIPRFTGCYKNKRMTPEEAFSHWVHNPDDNVGILTGKEVIVFDADKHNPEERAPEALLYAFPELKNTAHVSTNRGEHYYLDPKGLDISSGCFLLDGEKIDVYSNTGNKKHICAPISTIDNFTRLFDRYSPVIQPIPSELLKLILNLPSVDYVKNTVQNKGISLRFPVKTCTQQIADYQPIKPIGERTKTLYMLRNLLKRDRCSENSICYYVRLKNSLFEIPKEHDLVDKILKEKYYSYRCNTVIKELPYIDCSECLSKGCSMDLERVDKMTALPLVAMGIYYKHMKGKSLYQISKEGNITIKTVRYTLDKINKELDKGTDKASTDEG